MAIIRWLVRILAALVALVVLLLFGARFHDGPLGPIPGGPLASGELVAEPVSDWSFARDVKEIELQLASQERSRTVWLLVHEGQAYVPCSLSFPPGKRWHKLADKDGRATLRIQGRRFPVTLSRTDDPALGDALRAEVVRKYGNNVPPEGGGVWIFQVASRVPDAP
jgi:hypothetical protein